jgi:hypothetical protein
MRKAYLIGAIAVVVSGFGATLLAQVPAAPAPPAGASGLVGLIQMAAGAAKACKAKICSCPLGQMITNAGKPLNTALGGLLCPPCCPPVKDEDLKKPPTLPDGACAKIMQEELDMPKRRKAIQCLARADCHWWPEAEAALIAGLRADRNECVRLEAAKALANGCCCTRKTIEALLIVVTSSKKDGNPSENSERVKAMALLALEHCLHNYVEDEEPKQPELPKPPPEKVPPEKPPAAAEWEGLPLPNLAYYDNLDRTPASATIAAAKKALQAAHAAPPKSNATVAGTTGSRNIYQIWVSAQTQPSTPTRAAGEPPPLASATPARLTPAPRPAPVQPAPAPAPATVQLEFREN